MLLFGNEIGWTSERSTEEEIFDGLQWTKKDNAIKPEAYISWKSTEQVQNWEKFLVLAEGSWIASTSGMTRDAAQNE